jgi:hypothetical protein
MTRAHDAISAQGGGYGPPGGYGGPPPGAPPGGYGPPGGGGPGGYGPPGGGGPGGYGPPGGPGGYGPPSGPGGYGPPGYGPPGGAYGAPQPPMGGYGPPPANVDLKKQATTWLIVSAVSAFLCTCCIGVIGAVFCYMAMQAADQGNLADAQSKLKWGKIITLVGLALGVIATAISVPFYAAEIMALFASH